MIKQDALYIYKTLFCPGEGYFNTLLNDEDFEQGFRGRLDLLYDVQVNLKPVWHFIDFADRMKPKITLLKTDEVYGYLKARFPNKDWRIIIKEKVKKMTIKMFE